jgi:hypothetical protein
MHTFHLSLVFLLSVCAFAQNPPPPHSDLKDALRVYEKLTGRRLIYDKSVVGPMPTIMVNEKVPQEEALKIIETAMLKNGFSLVPTETTKVWKVFQSGQSSQPRPQ